MKKIQLISSVVCAVIGLYLLTSSTGVTGAFAGISATYVSLIGVTLILASVLILVYTPRLEERVISTYGFYDKIKKAEPDSKIRAVVLDTSAFSRNYTDQDVENLMRELKRGAVYVPEAVLDEIKSRSVRNYIIRNAQVVKGREEYKKIATHYLEQTPKAALCQNLLPFVEDQIEGKKTPIDARIRGYVNRVVALGRIRDYDSDRQEYTQQFWKEIQEELRHCDVSPADVEVLATAWDQAKQGKHAIIAAKDSDFPSALAIIKKENPSIGKLIDYVDNAA